MNPDDMPKTAYEVVSGVPRPLNKHEAIMLVSAPIELLRKYSSPKPVRRPVPRPLKRAVPQRHASGEATAGEGPEGSPGG